MLNREQMARVRLLSSLISQRTALPAEVEELANLFRKAGVPEHFSVEAILREAGFGSVEEFARCLGEATSAQAAKSLVYATMGLMLAYAVDHALAEA